MGIFDFLRTRESAPVRSEEPRLTDPETPTLTRPGSGLGNPAYGGNIKAAMGYDLTDPRLIEFLRDGGMMGDGEPVTVAEAMKNPTVLRCVSLISFSMGFLPLLLQDQATKENATEHPLFRVLRRKPNDWQTAFNFRHFMQKNVLCKGNAYALIVRGALGGVQRLVPLDPSAVTPHQRSDWTVIYRYKTPQGRTVDYHPEEILHVYGDTEDGISGIATVKRAAEAITLARQIAKSQRTLFEKGQMPGGALEHPATLSDEAFNRLKQSLSEHAGADNHHRFLILEEGMKAQAMGNGRDAQQIESRDFQTQEIARAFGVPRPLLMMDDTTWGSGVDVLGQLFVRYTLQPWFIAWQQAIDRSCLNDKEQEQYESKYDPRLLLQGSLKDLGEYFAKALGSGGHQPWMDYEEVRSDLDLPEREIAPNMLATKNGGGNEPKAVTED